MHCKYFLVDNGGNREVIKYVCKVFPHESVTIFCLTLHVKSIILGDRTGLVISPDHMHLCGIFDLIQTQKCDDLYRMCPSIYKIS